MKLTTIMLRSMLVEEAYLARFASPPQLPAASIEILERSFVTGEPELATAKSMARFADCLVFNDTAGADALLRTVPRSDNERAAARALAPTLGACLSSGQTLTLQPANIRAFVADGLWTRFARDAASANPR